MNKNFRPGSLGFHELFDRAQVIAEEFSDHIAQHPAAKHPKLKKRIAKIEADLFRLYQRIGDLYP